MFRNLRRFKQAISVEECKSILSSQKRAVLSVNGDDGYPYALPINFYFDKEDNKIYFHSALSGHKVDSIGKSDKVCFTVLGDEEKSDDWSYFVKSVIVFGRAKVVSDLSVKLDKARKFGLKYYPDKSELNAEIERDFDRMQMFEISIEHISGKRVHEK